MPGFDLLTITMTGELCDCYESKRAGVGAILDAVETVTAGIEIRIWRNDGCFVDVSTARTSPYSVAAANWLALATYAGRFAPEGPGLLLDIGSTTTDIVPLRDGKPTPLGRTDPERLRLGELVYTGVRRTPLCAILQASGAAEFFATTLDAYLILGAIEENENDRDTADSRPASKVAAHARLARMLCADLETSTEQQRLELARLAYTLQQDSITSAMKRVIESMGRPPSTYVLAGCGEFLGLQLIGPRRHSSNVVSLKSVLGAAASQAGPAYALAVLAAEQCDTDS
jgi:probable H4MPT-linked C1 transfer pathway protein